MYVGSFDGCAFGKLHYSSQGTEFFALSLSEQARQKVAVKTKTFVMLVKIKGPSVRYVLCALCPKSKWEFELPKGL